MSNHPRKQHGFYYMEIDGNGVLCVDQIDAKGDPEENARALAAIYRNVIYFEYEPEMQTFDFTVTINATSLAKAEQALGERLNHDEDHGFPYSIVGWARG